MSLCVVGLAVDSGVVEQMDGVGEQRPVDRERVGNRHVREVALGVVNRVVRYDVPSILRAAAI